MSAALVAPHGPTRVNQRMPHSPDGRTTRSWTVPSPRAAWTMLETSASTPADSASAGTSKIGDLLVDGLGLGRAEQLLAAARERADLQLAVDEQEGVAGLRARGSRAP